MINLPGYPDLDLYAEVVAAHLLEQDKLKRDELYVFPQGLQKRGYAKDLQEVAQFRGVDGSSRTVMKLNREGLYDMLPEAVFHKPISRSLQISTQRSKARFEQRKKEEKEGRKFFQPLEQVLYQQRINVVLNEQQRLPGLSETAAFQLVSQFIDADAPLTHYEALTLLYIFPRLHIITGNLALSSQCIAWLLRMPVQVKKTTCPIHLRVNDKGLGENRLGIDSILDYCLEEEVFTLHFDLNSNTKVNELLEQKDKILKLVEALFFPAHASVQISTYHPNHVFTPGKSSESSRLGYSTTI